MGSVLIRVAWSAFDQSSCGPREERLISILYDGGQCTGICWGGWEFTCHCDCISWHSENQVNLTVMDPSWESLMGFIVCWHLMLYKHDYIEAIDGWCVIHPQLWDSLAFLYCSFPSHCKACQVGIVVSSNWNIENLGLCNWLVEMIHVKLAVIIVVR